MFLFELLVGELPAVRRHAGPPLWNRVNADKFREKHLAERTAGPYIVEGKVRNGSATGIYLGKRSAFIAGTPYDRESGQACPAVS